MQRGALARVLYSRIHRSGRVRQNVADDRQRLPGPRSCGNRAAWTTRRAAFGCAAEHRGAGVLGGPIVCRIVLVVNA